MDSNKIKEVITKTLLPAILAVLTMLGAFNLKLEYVKASNQETMGKLVVQLTRGKECK